MQLRTAAMFFLACMLASCAWLTPEQQQTALQVVDSMMAQGSITRAQHDALVEALLSGSSTAWWQQLVQVIGGAALAYAGVQWRRGPVATPAERVARMTGVAGSAPAGA
jgi:hypothetical protein